VSTLTPAQQAAYHAGCAGKHFARAVLALFEYSSVRVGLLVVAAILGFLLSGCSTNVVSVAPAAIAIADAEKSLPN
jgi:hypothetical protein